MDVIVFISIFSIFVYKSFCHIGHLTNLLKSKDLTTLACQNDTENIACDDYEGIRVKDAFWGRDNTVDCQSDDPLSYLTHKETCLPLDKDYAYRKVTELCQDKQVCVVAGTPLFFDTELCPFVRKYARVIYECRQMSGMKKSDIDEEVGKRKSLIDGTLMHLRNKTKHSLKNVKKKSSIKSKKLKSKIKDKDKNNYETVDGINSVENIKTNTSLSTYKPGMLEMAVDLQKQKRKNKLKMKKKKAEKRKKKRDKKKRKGHVKYSSKSQEEKQSQHS